VIVLDTHVLVWSVLEPKKLSREAERALRRRQRMLVPSVCLWEFAMMVTRGEVSLNAGLYGEIVETMLAPDNVSLQELTPAIALRAAQLSMVRRMDPADQLIAATALEFRSPLVSTDERLRAIPGLEIIW